MKGRYRTDSEDDVVKRIRDIRRRIEILESRTKIGATAIDNGTLRLRGFSSIIVEDDDGNGVIYVFNAAPPFGPQISLTPAGFDTHFVAMITRDIDFDGIIQTFATYGVFRTSDGVSDGGIFDIFETGATIGYDPEAFGAGGDAYYQCRDESPFGGGLFQDNVRIVGRWLNNTAVDAEDATYAGNVGTAAVSSVTISYPLTFTTVMYPVIGVVNAGGAQSFVLTAQSEASFTVAWTGGAVAKTITMWNIRM